MTERIPFGCSGCGACCRTIPFQLGWVENEGEACPMLEEETNQCKIYETRPPVCDVEGVYERRVADLGMSWLAWCALNAGICKGLIDDSGLDPKLYPEVSSVGLVQLQSWTGGSRSRAKPSISQSTRDTARSFPVKTFGAIQNLFREEPTTIDGVEVELTDEELAVLDTLDSVVEAVSK